MAQHDYKRSAGLVVIRGDISAAFRLDSEGFEKSAAHLSDLNLHRLEAGSISQGGEHFAADFCEGVSGGSHISQIKSRLVGSESDQTIRLLIAERPQEHRVDDAEDRRIRADAERECDNCHRGETRPREKAANRVADVFE